MIAIFMGLIMNKNDTSYCFGFGAGSYCFVSRFRSELGTMMKEGVKEIALTGVMLILRSYILA